MGTQEGFGSYYNCAKDACSGPQPPLRLVSLSASHPASASRTSWLPLKYSRLSLTLGLCIYSSLCLESCSHKQLAMWLALFVHSTWLTLFRSLPQCHQMRGFFPLIPSKIAPLSHHSLRNSAFLFFISLINTEIVFAFDSLFT